jgi:hypothetical protein
MDLENFGKYHRVIMWAKMHIICSLMWTPIWREWTSRSESTAILTHPWKFLTIQSNAKVQCRRIQLSSTRSNDHLGEQNVHIIALRINIPIRYHVYDSIAIHLTIIMPKSTIYILQLPIRQIWLLSISWVYYCFWCRNFKSDNHHQFPPLSRERKENMCFLVDHELY